MIRNKISMCSACVFATEKENTTDATTVVCCILTAGRRIIYHFYHNVSRNVDTCKKQQVVLLAGKDQPRGMAIVESLCLEQRAPA